MELLDTVSLTILLGAVLVLAGILSSLVALRFGAPLLLVFLVIGMLAGESGLGGIKFDDVQPTYMGGPAPPPPILFDAGRATRLRPAPTGLGPPLVLATTGALLPAGRSCGRSIVLVFRRDCMHRSSRPARSSCSAWPRSSMVRDTLRPISPVLSSATGRRAPTTRWWSFSTP